MVLVWVRTPPKKNLAQMLHGAGVFTYPNVGKLTIHWASGWVVFHLEQNTSIHFRDLEDTILHTWLLYDSQIWISVQTDPFFKPTKTIFRPAGTSFSYRKNMFYTYLPSSSIIHRTRSIHGTGIFTYVHLVDFHGKCTSGEYTSLMGILWVPSS